MSSLKFIKSTEQDQVVERGVRAVVKLEDGKKLTFTSYHPAEATERVMEWVEKQRVISERLAKEITYKIEEFESISVGSFHL